MFDRWIIKDIEEAGKKSDRIVISDPQKFLTFMAKELKDYTLLTVNSPDQEMAARHEAMTAHRGSKVIFLCFFRKNQIRQLIEFAGIGGFIDMDNPDRYIRARLHEQGLGNVSLPESKLLLAARLSIGKELPWWKGIVYESIKPLDLKEHLFQLISDPSKYQAQHDEQIFEVLREEVFAIMGKTATPVDAPTLLRELSNSIFAGLSANNINNELLGIYYWWASNTSLIPHLRDQIEDWKIPAEALPLSAHPDHPFAELDRKLLKMIGERLRQNSTLVDLSVAIRRRILSLNASDFKSSWLPDLLTLLDFDSSGLYRYDTIEKTTEYYRSKFAPLDSAMRHLYNCWLGEPALLRPLQELYEAHLKSLLSVWFAVAKDNYQPSQLRLIEEALGAARKVAVLVCDGLRLEIAESITKRLPKSVSIKPEVKNAKLPSVTENGMSALFGIDCVVTSTSLRFDNLRNAVPGVEIINYINLGNDGMADKLVILFGDIDQVGEHKGLAGLRDINNYEAELTMAISKLHRLGYSDVFLTADHGFVITGLLDEASKVPPPEGGEVVVKERFCLSDDCLSLSNLIIRSDNFPGGNYQYYAKTDRPFRSRGAYGFAHGGFSPQECLIPFYRFSFSSGNHTLEVKIANKEALTAVTGQFFSVKLKGNEAAKEVRVRVALFKDGRSVASSIVKLDDKREGAVEFEALQGNLSIVVQDVSAGIVLDNAPVVKSASRDLDDLF